jgi:hypothetical protein
MSAKTLIRNMDTLNKSMMECEAFLSMLKEMLLVPPNGNGITVMFVQEHFRSLQLAIELHNKLDKHNKTKMSSETTRIRIGIHACNVYIVNDILDSKNA